MNTGIHTAANTSSEPDERPWYRRSPLWQQEAEIRRLQVEGYSLAQIIRRLGLGVSRP
jgi:DNA-binding CsgD family transcriptional regulator